jgi:PST family polysaccharide transporter
VAYWAFLARAKTGSLLKYNLVTKGLVFLGTVIGSTFGVYGIAVGFAVGLALSWPISVLWLRGTIRNPAWPLIAGGLRFISVGVLAAIAGLLAESVLGQGTWQSLLVLIAWGLGLTLPVSLRPFRRDFCTIVSMLNRLKSSKSRV